MEDPRAPINAPRAPMEDSRATIEGQRVPIESTRAAIQGGRGRLGDRWVLFRVRI